MTVTSSQKRTIGLTNTLLLYGVYLVYASLLGIIAVFSKGFFQPVNLVHLLTQSSVLIIVCVGNTFVLLTAGIDMSVGSIAFFCPALASYLLTNFHISPWTAIALILVMGMILGMFNGIIIKQLNIYPLITTLGILFAGRGLGQYLLQGGVKVLPAEIQFAGNGTLGGVPIAIIIAGFFLMLGQFTLTSTNFGRRVVAIGDNEEAAAKSGINVGMTKFCVYAISGFVAAVAGLVLTGQVSVVDPDIGKDLEFDVLIALVLGGVSLFGAKGSVFPGAFIGVLFLTTIFNGLIASNASPYLFPVIKGLVIFMAIFIDTIKTRRNIFSIYKTVRISEG